MYYVRKQLNIRIKCWRLLWSVCVKTSFCPQGDKSGQSIFPFWTEKVKVKSFKNYILLHEVQYEAVCKKILNKWWHFFFPLSVILLFQLQQIDLRMNFHVFHLQAAHSYKDSHQHTGKKFGAGAVILVVLQCSMPSADKFQRGIL